MWGAGKNRGTAAHRPARERYPHNHAFGRGLFMPIPAKAFQRWLQSIAPDASTADVCRVSGIKRTTLAQQLVRGKVAVHTVVSISRAYHANPVAALAGFDAY